MNPPAIEAALAYRRELEARLAELERERSNLRAQITYVDKFIAAWEQFAGQKAQVNAPRTP